jgi:hypothetical protein
MLTREEAQKLILTRLKARQDAPDHFVKEERTVECQFGWLFFVAPNATVGAESARYRLIIVNKHVEQVIGSSIEYTPERFIEIYETLLAKSQGRGEGWCLTISFPLYWGALERWRFGQKAKKMGLYEIG